jgi:hypothetical protein
MSAPANHERQPDLSRSTVRFLSVQRAGLISTLLWACLAPPGVAATPAAAMNCARGAAVAVAPPAPPPPVRARGPACTWTTAAQLAADPSVQWVDARPLRADSRVRLSSAWELASAGELASAAAAAPPRLALYGNGLDRVEVDAHCRQLRAQGLSDVRAVLGGLRAALRAGVPAWRKGLSADHADQILAEVSPAQTHAALRAGSASVLIVNHSKRDFLADAALAGAHQVDTLSAIEPVLRALAADKPLVIAASAAERALLEAQLESNQLADAVFWVEGGTEALGEHLEQFRLVAEAAHTPLTQPCYAQPKN